MIKSMTGFGRGEATINQKTFTVEIRTVNHRYNDISIRMPRQFGSLEDKIREFVLSKISRGKIDIYITFNTIGTENKKIVFDEQLSDEYVSILGKIVSRYDLNDSMNLSIITRFPDIIKVENKDEDQEEIWLIMSSALEEALKSLVIMRENEGRRLKEDLLKRLDYINETVTKVEEKAPLVVEEYRIKLGNRIKELMKDNIVDENRIATEVAIMADRSSIAEEIVRLYSHLKEMKLTLDNNASIGRKLDFIVQEMNREANTINSKSNEIYIINSMVEVKSEIEKIREQVQNIE